MMMWKKQMKRMRAAQRRRRRRKKNYSWLSGVLGVVVLFFLCCLFLNNASLAGEDQEVKVTLKADDISIIQGEAVPAFTVRAECTQGADTVLDEDSGYTVQSLVDELNNGTGYTVSCTGDGNQEGDFEIEPKLTSDITTPLYADWFGSVRIDIENGTLTVKNPYGEWVGNKFQRWDGSYVESDFVTYHGKTYYLGADGKKVSGWQEINESTYFFNERGVMQTGWMETEEGSRYFREDGVMQLGWLFMDGERYYFNQDGWMATGEQTIGGRKCVFAKDGKLESEENGVNPDAPMVALTFDDGPGPRTEELLKVLQENHARATFFMLGQKVEKYADTVKLMLETGCQLGNHSYDHANLTKLDANGISEEMRKTDNIIAEACGQRPTVARPPYGAISDAVKANIGLPMILWSVDTLDWKTRNVQSTIDNVMNNLTDGQIILMHDIHTQTIDAAIQLIPKIQEAGYQLVTVSEMAAARGITMENGVKYAEFWK